MNIWKNWWTEDAAGNRTPVPFAERNVRQVVWYTTPELPAHLGDQESASLYHQINAGLEGMRKENHALLVKMLAQLVLAEVRLFQHERPD